MSPASFLLTKKGGVNLPGITPLSKKTAEDLLLKDAEDHHCFVNNTSFHNHLSHHLLAAYDLGASAGVLQKIYDDQAKVQRPIYLEAQHEDEIVVNKDNWTQHLGNQNAYGAYVKLFNEEIQSLGVTKLLETYLFTEDANKDGRLMFVRFSSGAAALHPIIQVGYGVEFGNDELIVTGLAQAAVHPPDGPETFEWVSHGPVQGQGISLLEVLSQAYEAESIEPLPFSRDKNPFFLIKDALAKNKGIGPIASQFHISDTPTEEEVDNAIEEIIWVSNLLLFSSGKRGRKTRLDFFIMHLVTCSVFLKPLCEALKKPEYQANLIRGYVAAMILIMMWRGLPKIDPELAMLPTASPRPPSVPGAPATRTAAMGSPNEDDNYNAWPAIIEDAQYHSEAHLVKAVRGVLYAAQKYSHTKAGDVPGAYRDKERTQETFPGIGKVDGTMFVRSAGVMMEQLGWMTHGQKVGQWTFIPLGWDSAWDALQD